MTTTAVRQSIVVLSGSLLRHIASILAGSGARAGPGAPWLLILNRRDESRLRAHCVNGWIKIHHEMEDVEAKDEGDGPFEDC